MALPVRAIGQDASGNSFRHVVCTLDVSQQGARILGSQDLHVGNEITLEHGKTKVRFEVMWVGEAETPRQGQVGLRSLEPGKKLAELDELLGGEYVDTWSPPKCAIEELQADRRAVARFDCDRGVQFWTNPSDEPVTGRLDNISLNGCFIGTRHPLPRSTRLSAALFLYGIKIQVKGEVRVCWAGEGMGVLFTGFEGDSEVRLKKAVQRLANSEALSGTLAKVESEVSERILADVREWFDRNPDLSWEQFFDIAVRHRGQLVKVSDSQEFVE